MKGRVWLTVFLLLFVCLASTAFAEQVVEVWRYPWGGLETLAASADDGSVWVAARRSGTVLRLAPGLGGGLREVVRVSGFAGASAIAANSEDGSCWVGDCCFGQVVHLAADGTELSRTGFIFEPVGLSVDPTDGSCWVANRDQMYDGCSVVHLAANGTELSRTYHYGVTSGIAAVPGTDSCWFGTCYDDAVVHLRDNLDGSTDELSSAPGFSGPESISVESGGTTLWVADLSSEEVTRLQEDPDDYSITTLSTTPMGRPASVSALPGGGAWVADCCPDGSSAQSSAVRLDADGNADLTITDIDGAHAVSVDDSTGACWVLGFADLARLDAVGDPAGGTTGFGVPLSIAADPSDGSSWVADCSAGRLSHVTADGEVVPFARDELGAPTYVVVNPADGSLWVIDRCGEYDGDEVVHLAADGSVISRTSDEFCCLQSLAVDPNDGSCWVVDGGSSVECLMRLDAEDGALTRVLGGCFGGVTAIAVDPTDSTFWLGVTLGLEPTAALAPSGGNAVVHFEMVDDEPWPTSGVLVPEPAISLAVDPFDSSCLAGLFTEWRVEPDFASLDGEPSEPSSHAVLRVTDTPSGAVAAMLGLFSRPMSLSVSPLDRSIWVGDALQVGHLAADGTLLSQTTGYCCVASVSVDTGDGSCWIAAQWSADVADLAVMPEAEFTASADTGVAPFEVSFTDLSTGAPTSWAWTFGDGGTSTEQNPSHTYGLGHYTVSLTVEGVGGSDTETKINYIYAGAIAPTADFSATPTTGQAPLTVTFEDLSTNSPTEWLWSFGDGASSDAQNPTHEYQEQGVYTVSLVVTNSQGFDVETKTDYITVQQPLTAAFSTDVTRGASPLGVQFTDESVGGVTSWLWSFGDGDTATAQNPIHYYEDPGFYTVTLLVWKGGVSASVTKTACIAVGFTDTPGDHWALLQEIACAEAGIVQGYWDGSYDPYGLVTRSQMATFIARALAGGDENVPSGPATPTFADVDPDYWAYNYIEYCADQDIVVGYWGDMYRPDDTVDRGQMAVFIARTVAVPTGMEDYTPPATPTFSDVTSTNEWDWCYKYVEYVAALDPPIVVGYPDETYRPQLTVTRDQMAVYMQRAFDLPIPSSTP